MAVGKSGAAADRDLLRSGSATSWWPKRDGSPKAIREADGAAYMKGDLLTIAVDLGLGTGARRRSGPAI
jgi:glutamate N-acetyltransferase/amino-acid N-acetyltransferase